MLQYFVVKHRRANKMITKAGMALKLMIKKRKELFNKISNKTLKISIEGVNYHIICFKLNYRGELALITACNRISIKFPENC